MDLHADAVTHLDTEVVTKPVFFAYLDILGDPIRATTAGHDWSFPAASTGDDDLDGQTFFGVDPTVVEIGDVVNEEGGSDTLTCSLSGLLLPDADLLATIANPANWRGRVARLWVLIRDETGAAQGTIAHFYTGYMASLEIKPGPDQQTIVLKIENYLALLTKASNRSYLSQSEYDPNDQSARATISAANGARTGPAAAIGITPPDVRNPHTGSVHPF